MAADLEYFVMPRWPEYEPAPGQWTAPSYRDSMAQAQGPFQPGRFQTLIDAVDRGEDYRALGPPGIWGRSPEDRGFDMGVVWHSDGVPSCAWGHYLHAVGRPAIIKRYDYVYDAAREFGITPYEAVEIFDYDGCGNARRDRLKAVAYLREFLASKVHGAPRTIARRGLLPYEVRLQAREEERHCRHREEYQHYRAAPVFPVMMDEGVAIQDWTTVVVSGTFSPQSGTFRARFLPLTITAAPDAPVTVGLAEAA